MRVVVAGIFDLISPVDVGALPSLESIANSITTGVFGITLGLVAIVGSREVKRLLWDVVLIVVGVLAYKYLDSFLFHLDPLLVVLAVLVGMVAKLSF